MAAAEDHGEVAGSDDGRDGVGKHVLRAFQIVSVDGDGAGVVTQTVVVDRHVSEGTADRIGSFRSTGATVVAGDALIGGEADEGHPGIGGRWVIRRADRGGPEGVVRVGAVDTAGPGFGKSALEQM